MLVTRQVIKYNSLILFVLLICLPLQSEFYKFKSRIFNLSINAYYTTVS